MNRLNISKELNDYLETSIQDIVDDNGVPENYGGCVDTMVQSVAHESYSGFIPFTNGGFDLTLPTDLNSVVSSGAAPTEAVADKIIEDAIDYSLEMAFDSFMDEKREELAEIFTPEEMNAKYSESIISYSELDERNQGSLAEELSEYENSCLTEGSTFFYQFRVLFFADDNCRNELGEDELLFMAGTNLDFEYGRDKGLEVSYEKSVPLKGLTTDMVDQIIKDMVASI